MNDPSFDAVLDLCRNEHRRIVLALLMTEEQSLTLDDITRTVLTCNHHISPTEASEEELARTRSSLHHNHLPKLASEGLIIYEPDKGHVAVTERFEEAQPVVSTVLDMDPKLETPVEA